MALVWCKRFILPLQCRRERWGSAAVGRALAVHHRLALLRAQSAGAALLLDIILNMCRWLVPSWLSCVAPYQTHELPCIKIVQGSGMHFHGLCIALKALISVAPQDAHRPSDEWLRTPRKRSRTTSQYSVTAVLFLRSDHLLATAGARPARQGGFAALHARPAAASSSHCVSSDAG